MNKWACEQLANLGEIVTGTTPNTSMEDFYGGHIPFVTPADLDRPEPILNTPRMLTDLGSTKARILPEGTVMVCCIGTIGKVGIAGTKLCTNQQINSIIFDVRKVLPRFGLHACRQLKAILRANSPATTLPIVSKSRFMRMKIPVPSLAQQQWITEVLDQADEIRAKRRAAIALLDSLSGSMFLDMFGSPVQNPHDWPEIPLGECITEGPQNGLYKAASFYGSGAPIVRIDAFYDGEIRDISTLKRLEVSDVERQRFALSPDDILINRVNSLEYLGKSALVPSLVEPTVFESNMMRLRVDEQRISPKFLVQLLQSRSIKSQIQSSAKNAVNQSSINQKDVGALRIFVPPIELQRSYVERLEAAGRCKASALVQLTEMDDLFGSLQDRAFRGELWED